MSSFHIPPMDVVDFAHQILAMDRKLQEQEHELQILREYRQKYMDLLNSSIDHSKHMTAGLLKLAMTPGVMEACAQANKG